MNERVRMEVIALHQGNVRVVADSTAPNANWTSMSAPLSNTNVIATQSVAICLDGTRAPAVRASARRTLTRCEAPFVEVIH